MKNWKEEYELAERENDNLRTALAWAASHLTDAERDELEKRLDAQIEQGGVTGETCEDLPVEILNKIVKHVEPLLTSGYPELVNRRLWTQRLDHLIEQAREFEPKHPVMRRLGGHPNVFGPALPFKKPREL